MNKKNIIIIGCSIGVVMILAAIFLYFNSNKNYVVAFDTNGGSRISSQIIEKGSSATKPSNPEKDGYEFVGWNYNGQNYDFSSEVKSNIKLVAVWKESKVDDIKTFIVTFDSDGGSSVEIQNVIENFSCSEPTNPTKDGYTFDGWYLDDVKYNFEEKITKDITLKAKWTKIPSNANSNSNIGSNVAWYKITFDSDGGSSVNEQMVMSGRTASKPANPTKNGKIFDQWQLNGKTYDFNNKVTGNITLKAVWREPRMLTVKFMFDDNNVWDTKTVLEGNKVEEPKYPASEGFIFGGWYLNGTYFSIINTPVTSDMTLKAYWHKAYQITAYLSPKIGPHGTSVVAGRKLGDALSIFQDSLNDTPEKKAGCTFKGWKLNDEFINSNMEVNSNLIVTAEWEC